mgnify:CR=1 FL=1
MNLKIVNETYYKKIRIICDNKITILNKNETAIFELTNDGLKKAYAYNVRNMGDAALFSDFLTYAYKNYKAKEYDLVMWNHGAGAFGSNSDELTNDSLDTTELQKGLKNKKACVFLLKGVFFNSVF